MSAPDDKPDELAGTEQPFVSHLIELRDRLIRAAIAVALADKLDTLVGFWAINEKPTGSGDPYQLRRAAPYVLTVETEARGGRRKCRPRSRETASQALTPRTLLPRSSSAGE